MATKIQHIRTLRLKVKAEGHSWLNAAAIEVNQTWNFANASSYKAARPFAGHPKWLTAFDLDKLTAGASKCFEGRAAQRFPNKHRKESSRLRYSCAALMETT
jgi:hypothetical protein